MQTDETVLRVIVGIALAVFLVGAKALDLIAAWKKRRDIRKLTEED